jgi:SIR2-like domain
MIDPMLSLAFSVHANKGVFALLLGSGVSRAAAIPTGWEIVLDLIRKLAHLRAEDCDPDPAAWYRATFGEEPDYAKLLDALANSPAERSQLLRSYFEPTDEEREQGLKIPTAAHRAIADLVASGHIRVIVTTNFDRLPENALESLGIVPTVISTPDAVEGALPLAHTACTILKVHGDYLDSRIKNTPTELSHYDRHFNRLLDQIFDEYGLIVCGWSAEWDTALRAAMERCSSHRFTTFWTTIEEPRETAKKLITLRRAQLMTIQNADIFFRDLAEKVTALQDLAAPHPLSAKVAVATVKRYLVDPQHRIRLYDLVMQETERLYGEVSDAQFPAQGPSSLERILEEMVRQIPRYEAVSEILLALMITGCYWGEPHQTEIWRKSLERMANPSEGRGSTPLIKLRSYPALRLLYGGGIAAIATGRYDTLFKLLHHVAIRDNARGKFAVLTLYPQVVIDDSYAKHLPGLENRRTPVSDHLYITLREPLREFLPGDNDYTRCFDRFEYLFALAHSAHTNTWPPLGCFWWRYIDYPEDSIEREIELEAATAGANWSPLQAGFFDGSLQKFQEEKRILDNFLRDIRRGRH